VRQAFEPKAPPLEQRWRALEELRAAGIPVGICVTPLLPRGRRGVCGPVGRLHPEVLVVQDFHDSGGGFGATRGGRPRTAGRGALGLRMSMGFSWACYGRVVRFLKANKIFPPPPTIAKMT